MNVAIVLTALLLSAAGADQLLADPSGKPGGGLGPLHFTRTDQEPDRIRFTFRTDAGQTVRLALGRRDDARPADARTTRYNLNLGVEPSGAREILGPAIDRLVSRIRDRETSGPELRRLRVDDPYAPRTIDGEGDQRLRGPPGAGPFRQVGSSGDLDLWICLILLALALASIPALGVEIWPHLGRSATTLGNRSVLTLSGLAFLFVVAVQLLCVPRLLVTVFSGYGSVEAAWAMVPVAKYGAATTALYGPLLKLFGPSIGVITATNLVVGLLSVLLFGAVASRLAGHGRAAVVGILLVGLLPALLRDRASESVLIPMVWWLMASWLWLDAWLERRRPAALVFGVIHLALALHARPEVWVVAPVILFSLPTLEHRWGRVLAHKRPLFLGGALLALLAAPRLLSLIAYMSDAAAHGGVPGLSDGGDHAGMVSRFFSSNALFTPDIHPLTTTLLAALVPLLAPRGRRMANSLWLLAAFLWVAVSTADLPPVSVPRVQAPAMAWVAMLSAVTLGAAGGRSLPIATPAVWLLGLWILVPTAATVNHLWAPTNAQRFDDWWQRAIPKVESTERTRCLVALSMGDAPRDIVLRHYPLYELEALSGKVERYGLQTFLEAPGQLMDGHCELLYLQGPQCSARFHGFGKEPPKEAELLPLCQDMHRGFHLEPVHVEDVQNAGNTGFPFYGQSETLRYGLYRITRQAMPPP